MRRQRVRDQSTRSRKRREYGLTDQDLDALPKQCEVCGSEEDLCIDHDHRTGVVRGTLCRKCNLALGNVNDSVSILEGLIQYLREK